MTAPMDVCTTIDAYRAAAWELPRSVRLSQRPKGAIVVIEGSNGWEFGVGEAVSEGARGVVVTDPCAAVDIELAAAAAGGTPIVIDRPGVREDVASAIQGRRNDRGLPVPQVLVGECSGTQAALHRVLRDTAAWVRILGGSQLQVDAASGDGRGASLLAKSVQGAPFAVSLVATCIDAGEPLIRVSALGEVAVDVVVDAARLRTELVVSDRDGQWRAPLQRETHERLALRRMLAACDTAGMPADLAMLAADDEVAGAVFQQISN